MLPTTIGVPLGIALAPLVFIVYVIDVSQASELFNFVIFADDTTLSISLDYLSKITLNAKSTKPYSKPV